MVQNVKDNLPKLLSFVFLLSVFVVLSHLVLSQDVYAQRGASCGQGCDPNRNTCLANSYCHPTQKICFQIGCDPALGQTACCRSQRPPRPNPTQPPAGGNPGVPNPGTNPGLPNVTNPPSNVNPNPSGKVTPPGGGQPPVDRGNPADCSGPTAGQPDGNVDLLDFNYLRLGFSGDSPTGCDVNGNGQVQNDLEDFNQFRLAFTGQR